MEARDLFLAEAIPTEEVRNFLSELGFRDPERADLHLQQIAVSTGRPDLLAHMADILLGEISRSVDPDAAVRHFEAYVEHSPGPSNLLALLDESPRTLEVLIAILGGSPFLTQILLRSPEHLYWLMEKNRLIRVGDLGYFRKQAAEATHAFDDPALALESLRRCRRREALRIGAQDLLGVTGMQQIVGQISDLADAILHQVYDVLTANRPPEVREFAVIGLGKLGGRELNFSSDVDLIFVHGDDAPAEAVVRFARDYSRALTEFTGEGHLYRVDLRLRPMGKSGDIVYSESACRQYYQTWADTTDRLALIKARPVAGDPELGRRFVESIREFVFKKYLDHAAVEEIRWIKKRTDAGLRRKGQAETHVKLGMGGIREIEFFAQAFQMLYAGANPTLQTGSTLTALDRLVDLGFISMQDHAALREAYVFLRDLEHKLQLVHDLQTHSLPDEAEELLRCAKRMGYRAGSPVEDDPTAGPDRSSRPEDEQDLLRRFRADLAERTSMVRRIYDSLFEESTGERGLGELVLNAGLAPEEAVGRLAGLGFSRAQEIYEGYQLLLRAPSFPYSPGRMRNLLANLAPVLAEMAESAPEPRELFSRFDRFSEAVGARAPLYTEMNENPAFARRLLTVLSLGERFTETLILHPELLEGVITLSVPADPADSLAHFLSDRAGTESRRELLRQVKKREEFKIAMHELDAPGARETRRFLSRLAEASLERAWEWAIEKLPHMRAEPCILLALGKLGGRELAFHSDLDLVFLFDDRSTALEMPRWFEFLRAFREELVEYTTSGRAYEIDFRLRPEGKHAGEVVPFSRLQEYFTDRLEPWERLAYVKLRPVIEQGFSPDLASLVFSRPFSEAERLSLLHIRERKEKEIGQEDRLDVFDLKVGKGGLLDIQFVVQFLQIQQGVPEPGLAEAIDRLMAAGILAEEAGKILHRAMAFYFGLESVQDMLGVRETGKLSREPDHLKVSARWMGLDDGEQLTERYLEVSSAVRGIYNSAFRP